MWEFDIYWARTMQSTCSMHRISLLSIHIYYYVNLAEWNGDENLIAIMNITFFLFFGQCVLIFHEQKNPFSVVYFKEAFDEISFSIIFTKKNPISDEKREVDFFERNWLIRPENFAEFNERSTQQKFHTKIFAIEFISNKGHFHPTDSIAMNCYYSKESISLSKKSSKSSTTFGWHWFFFFYLTLIWKMMNYFD